MVLTILAVSFASFGIAGVVGHAAWFPIETRFTRNGSLRFFRIGRLSGSFCFRKAAA